MPKHKSIAQRLKYKLKPQVKQDIVNEWFKQQQDNFFEAYSALESAIGHNDLHETHLALDKLKDVGIKSFDAMPNIARELLSTPSDGNYD